MDDGKLPEVKRSRRRRGAQKRNTPQPGRALPPPEPLDHIKIFPKSYALHVKSAMHLLPNQSCILCNYYGCIPYFVTHKSQGGMPTGDNLLPVCKWCAGAPLVKLFRDYLEVRRWLIDHERLDVVFYLTNALKKRKDP